MNNPDNPAKNSFNDSDYEGLIAGFETHPTYLYRPGARANGSKPRGVFISAEHAGRMIPVKWSGLGLPRQELMRHIGWDIGIAGVCGALAKLVEGPMLLGRYSRLVVDLNRPERAPDCMLAISDTAVVPGNQDISPAAWEDRLARFHRPFHDAFTGFLAASAPRFLLSLHSFTPQLRMNAGAGSRPWHCGVLYGAATPLGQACINFFMGMPYLVVGENEPYQITPGGDYTVPVHGDARGLPAVVIEIRQDLIDHPAGQYLWARRLAKLIHHLDTG